MVAKSGQVNRPRVVRQQQIDGEQNFKHAHDERVGQCHQSQDVDVTLGPSGSQND